MGSGPVITIDGPAGAGKSTVSRLVARVLAYHYLDTGALYRALAYGAMERKMSPERCGASKDLCAELRLDLVPSGHGFRMLIAGEDVTDRLRTESVGLMASVISASESIRRALLPFQRGLAEKGGIVAEGRDMGTVVFPGAEFKFFLTADLSERVRRRFLELEGQKGEVDREKVKESILLRDRQDTGRQVAPLRVAEDAVVIDTTGLSIDAVVEKITSAVARGRTAPSPEPFPR